MMKFLMAFAVAMFPTIASAQALDYDIGNQTFPAFRADLNNHLQAIVQQNAGTTQPATRFPYMAWADTSGAAPIIRYRNAANSGWAAAFRIDPSSTTWLGGITTNSATITGGTIDGVNIGNSVRGTGTFSALTAFGPALIDTTRPELRFLESDTPTTHRIVHMEQDGGSFRIQTRNSAGTFVSTDYDMSRNASGASFHSLRVAGTERLGVGATGLIANGTSEHSLRISGTERLRTNSQGILANGTLGHEFAVNGTGYMTVSTAGTTSTAFITASDARLKHDISDIAEAECRAADRIELRRYRMNDGDGKWRFGAIAQEIIAAFDAEGLDWRDYAIVTGSEAETYGVAYDELQTLKLACM